MTANQKIVYDRDGAALDMSESLFGEFGDMGMGVFQMSEFDATSVACICLIYCPAWTLGGCGGGGSAPAVEAVANAVTDNDNNDDGSVSVSLLPK